MFLVQPMYHIIPQEGRSGPVPSQDGGTKGRAQMFLFPLLTGIWGRWSPDNNIDDFDDLY